MNTPVSYSIAKSVIQKGFEVKVRPMYYRAYKIETGSYMYNTDGVLELCTMPLVGLKKGWIDAPTIAEVVMWLYEKYGIWIQTPFSHNDAKPFCWSINKTIRNISEEDEDINCWLSGVDTEDINGWDSPAEATSEAIYYTLKKLI